MSTRRDPSTPVWPPPNDLCWKVPYKNRHQANEARLRIKDPKRRRNLHPYECARCKEWHLGS
jgi:hypothetical protein